MSIFGLFSRVHSDPRIMDPDLGELVFNFVKHNPANSYWQGQIPFEPTSDIISVALPGDINGPDEKARQFVLAAGKRFRRIHQLVKPKLRAALQQWVSKDVPENLFSMVKLASIDITDVSNEPADWELSFETKPGFRWCFISIRFEGNIPLDAVVDT